MIDLLPMPNFKEFEELLILMANLGVKEQKILTDEFDVLSEVPPGLFGLKNGYFSVAPSLW